MGAKWLYQLRSAPGQQTSTLHLFDRFEALGAKKVCKWSTQTTLCEPPLPGRQTTCSAHAFAACSPSAHPRGPPQGRDTPLRKWQAHQSG